MDGGIIEALGGRVEIGGLTAPGSVGLQVNDDNLSLAFLMVWLEQIFH